MTPEYNGASINEDAEHDEGNEDDGVDAIIEEEEEDGEVWFYSITPTHRLHWLVLHTIL